jgi:hypothetical protein
MIYSFYLRVNDDNAVLIGDRDLKIEPLCDMSRTYHLITQRNDGFESNDSEEIFRGTRDQCIALLDWIMSQNVNGYRSFVDARPFIAQL